MTTSELGERRMTQSRVFYQEPRTSKDTKIFCGLHMTYIPTEIAFAWDLKHNDCIRWCYFENAKKMAIIMKREGINPLRKTRFMDK
jgi:hypothetical protein